jgi:hypothetical protein
VIARIHARLPELRVGLFPPPHTIGSLEGLTVMSAGLVDGAEGRAIGASGRLYENALSAVVWPAIVSGRLRGLCGEYLASEASGRHVVREIRCVTLGGLENDCRPTARILEAWEGER